MDSGFAKLVEKFNTYVKLYDIDYGAVADFEVETILLMKEIEWTNMTIRGYDKAVSNARDAEIALNASESSYYSRDYRSSFDEWVARRDVESSAGNYRKRVNIVYEAEKEAREKKAKTEERIARYNAQKQRLYSTSLKYPMLARQTVEQMVSEYPSNPLSYLYKAEYYRQEALWRMEMLKFAYRRAYDVDDAMNIDLDVIEFVRNSVDDKSNVEAMRSELKVANRLMTGDVLSAYGAFISQLNNFVANYGKLISETNAELQRIEDEAGDRLEAEYKTEQKKDFKKKLRNTLILLAVLAAAGIAFYFFVIKKILL